MKDRIKNIEKSNAIILGIPRAGVVTADVVAKRLSISNFGIIVPRKLTDPENKEKAFGAIMEDGTDYLKQELIVDLQLSQKYLEEEKKRQIGEIKRRTAFYGLGHFDTSSIHETHETIILVDDGAATGATISVAVKWLRHMWRQQEDRKEKISLKRLIIAIPLAPKHTVNLLKKECNAEVEVILSPASSSFCSVEQYHKSFEPVSDQDVIKIIRSRRLHESI